MRAPRMLVDAVRRAARRLDVDVHRWSTRPESTLLGITALDIHTVVDVGAAAGAFVERVALHFPAARYVAFEPLDQFVPLLRDAGTRAGVELDVIQAAVGDRVGRTTFRRHTGHPGSSSVLAASASGLATYPFMEGFDELEVALTTLDAALAERPGEPELLVKLDVQGYEDRVIRGGDRTFARAAACVVEMSLLELYEEQAAFDVVHEQLRSSGLRFAGTLEQTIGADGRVVYLDAVYLRG